MRTALARPLRVEGLDKNVGFGNVEEVAAKREALKTPPAPEN